jgi:PGF-CTERM protein
MANNSIHHPGGTIDFVWRLNQPGGITAWNLGLAYSHEKRGFDMKKILVAMLIAMMMLMALSEAADVTKSTTTTTSITPATEPTSTTKSTTTTSTTPGFEATFAVVGLLAVTFVALRRRR